MTLAVAVVLLPCFLQPALVVLCGQGKTAAAKAAIAAGAVVNAAGKDQHGRVRTPLTAAVEGKNTDLVRHLLASGADPTAGGAIDRGVGVGTPEILQLLLDAGSSVNGDDSASMPPVFAVSVAVGDVEGKARILLAQPSLDMSVIWAGETPEQCARSHEQPAVAALIRDEVGARERERERERERMCVFESKRDFEI